MANVNWAVKPTGDQLEIGAQTRALYEPYWYDVAAAIANSGSGNSIGTFDHFLGDTLRDEWATDLSTGAGIAIDTSNTEGGQATFTTDTDDNDHATLALGLHWLVSNGTIVFEAAVKSVTAITVRAIEVGLSDALSETNGLAFSSHDATPVDVATNAAVFGYNTDDSMTTWSALAVNAGTPVYADTEVAPSTSGFQRLGIVIDSAGNVHYYIGGVGQPANFIATHSLGIATTALLTPWITLKSLSGAAKTINLDYVMCYGPVGY